MGIVEEIKKRQSDALAYAKVSERLQEIVDGMEIRGKDGLDLAQCDIKLHTQLMTPPTKRHIAEAVEDHLKKALSHMALIFEDRAKDLMGMDEEQPEKDEYREVEE